MLAFLPLDDRPCNVRFPQQIAAIGGERLLAPPLDTLGCFNTPGQPVTLSLWLRRLPTVEALIVSVDMLAYGGLVASRHTAVGEDEALAHLQVLREFRQERPETTLYAFNVLMRLAVTMDSDEAVANYFNVMRYARLADEAERFDSAHLRAELERVTAKIPSDVLTEYHAARARNHAVNRHMIDWLAEGVFDYLLIAQEDATQFGLHRREQDRLLAHAAARGVTGKMSLHPGTDEAGLTLLARYWNTGTRFCVHWSQPDDAPRIASYEDRPYNLALAQHIAAMRGVLEEEGNANNPDNADFELFVNAPVGGSQRDEAAEARAVRAVRLLPFIEAITAAVEAGQAVVLCDVAFPNGADNLLLTELEKRGVLGRLAAFGGWNTAGNTTGTLLAQCAAIQRSATIGGVAVRDTAAAPLNREFVFERLVDDWFYQSRARARLENTARAQGLSPLNMGDKAESIEAQARRELRGFAQLLAQRHFGTTLERCEIAFPWHRTFEVAVEAELA